MPQLPPLNALRAFEAVARLGGYAPAADELSVTSAAIGQHIRQLETMVGAPLFRRDGRTLILTERGHASREKLSRAFTLMDEASALMRNPDSRGSVTLAAPSGFLNGWFLPHFVRTPLFTTMRLKLHTIPHASSPNLALDHDADIAITCQSNTDPTSTQRGRSTPLMSETLAPMARPDIASAITSPSDLAAYIIIDASPGPTRWPDWLAQRAITMPTPPLIETQDPQTALTALATMPHQDATPAIAFISKINSAEAQKAGALAPVFPDGDMPLPETYTAHTPNDRPPSPETQALLAWLVTTATGFTDTADML